MGESELDLKILELEQAVKNAERELIQEASMPRGTVNKVYMSVAVVIPLIIALILYLAKPKFVLKKNKQVAWAHLVKWTLIISLLGWALLFGVHHFQRKK